MSAPGGGPTRPRLVAVPSPDASPEAPPPAGQSGRAGAAGAGRWVWVLAALLVLCFAGLALEARRADRLAAQLAASEARLRAAEARLSAYDAYLAAVRSRVGTVREQLEGLAGVLAADPAEGAPRK